MSFSPQHGYHRFRTVALPTMGALLLTWCLLPVAVYYRPYVGLDDSWRRSINLAVACGRQFGTDYIFTYGPLGFLDTRYEAYIDHWWFALSDVLLYSGYFFWFHPKLKEAPSSFVPFLVAVLFFRHANFTQKLLVLMVLQCIGMMDGASVGWWKAVLVSFMAAVMCFIKLSYAVPALLVWCIAIAWAMRNRHIATASAGMATLLGTIVVLAGWRHVALVDYVRNSIPIITNFSAASTVRLRADGFPVYGAVLYAMLCVVAVGAILRRGGKARFWVGAMAALTAAFLFKASFTRADPFHYNVFFQTLPFFLLSIMPSGGRRLRVLQYAIAVGGLVVSGVFVAWEVRAGMLGCDSVAVSQCLNPLQYFAASARATGEYPINREHTVLDPAICNLIGTHTIDILPTDVSTLQLNGLHYRPRPIPLSCNVYAPQLDSLNAGFFCGAKRADMVLIANEALAGHCAVWEESLTKAVLQLNDSVVRSDVHNVNGDYLLLASRNTSEYPEFRDAGRWQVKLGDTLRLDFPDARPVYFSAVLHPNALGSLSKILYYEPQAVVTLWWSDGGCTTYDAVLPQLAQPVLLSHAVRNNAELEHFFNGTLAQNPKVIALSFAASSGFEPVVDLRFFTFGNYRAR